MSLVVYIWLPKLLPNNFLRQHFHCTFVVDIYLVVEWFSLSSGGVDYIELSGVPVIFQPGGSSQATVTLVSLSDVLTEGDETLTAVLTVSSNNIDTSRIDLLVPVATVIITEKIGNSFASTFPHNHFKSSEFSLLAHQNGSY